MGGWARHSAGQSERPAQRGDSAGSPAQGANHANGTDVAQRALMLGPNNAAPRVTDVNIDVDLERSNKSRKCLTYSPQRAIGGVR